MRAEESSAVSDRRQRSLLGVIAGAYISWVVGSVCGAAAGMLVGVAVAGLEGAYVGTIIGVPIISSVCVFGGRFTDRILGGLVIGVTALAAGLTLGLGAGVAGGAIAGVMAGLLGAGRLEYGRVHRDSRALRVVIWAVLGATAGAVGFV